MITVLKLDQLKPNQYNPNRQTEAEFAENVGEVRRLGRLPKPIVVRRNGDDTYQIIDGEHGWRAAKEVGLVEVACEIVDADDFEAMLQTFKRNCSGTNNPVLLGRMFESMKKERNLSLRQLSREINSPESTIRSVVSYAEACRLRETYNADDCLEVIAGMSRREVQMYHDLGDILRDKWVDAGTFTKQLDGLFDASPHEIGALLSGTGLTEIVEGDLHRFRSSLEFAMNLADWRRDHMAVTDIDAYLRPVAELRLGDEREFPPLALLDLLPCHMHDDGCEVQLPAKQWASILRDAAGRTSDAEGLLACVERHVQLALRKAGIDPGEVLGPDVAEALDMVNKAPSFIRDAEFLSLDEKTWLAELKAEKPEDEDLVSCAKQHTCECLQQRRSKSDDQPGTSTDVPPSANSVEEVFDFYVAALVQQRKRASQDELFADHTRLVTTILAKLTAEGPISMATIDGRPASEVLAEQLKTCGKPEMVLLAASVFNASSLDDVASRWLEAMNER